MSQVRDGSFYPQATEQGRRNARVLMPALAEMDIQGVSASKAATITGQLCGFERTSIQVSRAAAQLDASPEQWRTRLLDACR